MAGERINGHDPSRLDRIEGMIEVLVNEHIEFAREHRQLLTAQVVLTDRLDRLTDRVDRLAVQVAELGESQKHTDERLNTLIATVDEIIRNPPRPSA
ncbi:MAG TPA: hypothetical protein VJ718_09305 [Candidatus Binataceae bacterium]|nr:hypothetical protein [Candidatus Binataceae bacterium]